MVKNVIIGVLLVVVLLLGVYASIQTGYAKENALEAEMQRIAATEQAVFARQAEVEAIVQKQEAEKQLKLAQEELEKCKNN